MTTAIRLYNRAIALQEQGYAHEQLTVRDRDVLREGFRAQLKAYEQFRNTPLRLLIAVNLAQVAWSLGDYGQARMWCCVVTDAIDAKCTDGVLKYARKEAERIGKVVEEKCNGG